jgi:EAL domain-containing protein (putative c-di-GMP-specific phosphodiesterase class I)
MQLSLLAEGVETDEQRVSLEGLGCHAWQGYLFSPPVPPEQFSAMLDTMSGSQPSEPSIR